MLPFEWYLGLSIIVMGIGIFAIATRKNLIKQIIGIEIIISAVHLNFIAMSLYFRNGYVDPFAQTIVIVSMSVGAGIIAVALSLTLKAYQHYKTLNTRRMNKLKW